MHTERDRKTHTNTEKETRMRKTHKDTRSSGDNKQHFSRAIFEGDTNNTAKIILVRIDMCTQHVGLSRSCYDVLVVAMRLLGCSGWLIGCWVV